MITLEQPPARSADPDPAGLRLSVLDLLPVRDGQSSAEALRAGVRLAQAAEAAGAHRYWVAEHHNMPAIASTNPPVLIGLLAGATQRIRVGSGGVMLPNHAPLVVAEQFALLEAAFPGRIDLGLGRAPGSDPVTNWALRHGGPETGEVDHFPEHIDNLVLMLSPEGVGLRLADRPYVLRATPHATGVPAVWLLGSSDYSARLAASKGLPYVFAHHFSGQGTAEALSLYRSKFRPSEMADRPRTFLTVNAVVAPTAEEAERLARPQLLAMVALRTGGELTAQRSVEAAEQVVLSGSHEALAGQIRARWIVGTPTAAAAQLADLATRFDVDEVMINPAAGAYATDALDANPAREQTVKLLAGALAATGQR